MLCCSSFFPLGGLAGLLGSLGRLCLCLSLLPSFLCSRCGWCRCSCPCWPRCWLPRLLDVQHHSGSTDVENCHDGHVLGRYCECPTEDANGKGQRHENHGQDASPPARGDCNSFVANVPPGCPQVSYAHTQHTSCEGYDDPPHLISDLFVHRNAAAVTVASSTAGIVRGLFQFGV